ncbi:MAG: hypothetical protein HY308_10575 [Gammaproteobacteria bacterium]|nr:hypothetical protein [Gammaproteobacteria bacterium]
MKKMLPLIIAVSLLTGCATSNKIDAIREVVDSGQIQGMDRATQFQYSAAFPFAMSGSHPGPYRSIDGLNISVETGRYKGKDATIFVGQSRRTNRWEVFGVMVEEEGVWRAVPMLTK